MELNPLAKHQRDIGRVAEIVTVLARYGLANWLRGIPWDWFQQFFKGPQGDVIADTPIAVRLRMVLTELGPTFIKLGQVLSTRPDLVGHDIAEELSKLQSQTPPDAPEVVRALIISELGETPEELFLEFDPIAFASASIAQVHAAILHTGEEVVLKVQKFNIEKKVEADLSILAWLADLAANHSPQVKLYEPAALVRQFRRTLLREFDFTYERRNTEEFTERFRNDLTVRFPKCYAEFSSRRILTMERLRGITGSDPVGLLASGADLNRFAIRGANLYLAMIFRDSFYHADPHPGNLMLLDNGVVGVLDCGMVGRLDERLRDEIENVLLAVAQSDAVALTDAIFRLSVRPPRETRDLLQADLSDFVGEFSGQSLGQIDISGALNSLTTIIREHHLVLPPSASLLLRTIVVLEGTGKLLNPSFSLSEIIKPFYRRALRRRLSPSRLLLRLQRSYRDWDILVQALPRDINEVLQRVRSGTFSVHLDHRHIDPIVNRVVLGIIIASMFLGSSLLWSMKAPPVVGGVSIFGAAGYLFSVYLGWRLFRAIKKTGELNSRDS